MANHNIINGYKISIEHEFGYYKPPNAIEYLRGMSSKVSHRKSKYNLYSHLVSRYAKIFERPFDIDWEGIRVRLYPDSNASDKYIFKYGFHSEQEDLDFLKDRYAGKNLSVLDIGANIGVYTLYLSKVLGQGSRIVSFEPHPLTFQRLLANLSFNLNSNVLPVNIGIGDKKEEAWLYSVNSKNVGQNSVFSKTGTEDKVKIQLDTLSNAIIENKISKVDFLKIDIEGFEDRALLPFMETCSESLLPKHILVENNRNSWNTDCFQYFAERGYQVIACHKHGENFHFLKA